MHKSSLGRYGANIRSGTSSYYCLSTINTDFRNFGFLLPIEVDFPERTENQASGIFGLVRDSHICKGDYAKHHCKFGFFKFSKILFSDRYVHCVFVAPFLEV